MDHVDGRRGVSHLRCQHAARVAEGDPAGSGDVLAIVSLATAHGEDVLKQSVRAYLYLRDGRRSRGGKPEDKTRSTKMGRAPVCVDKRQPQVVFYKVHYRLRQQHHPGLALLLRQAPGGRYGIAW